MICGRRTFRSSRAASRWTAISFSVPDRQVRRDDGPDRHRQDDAPGGHLRLAADPRGPHRAAGPRRDAPQAGRSRRGLRAAGPGLVPDDDRPRAPGVRPGRAQVAAGGRSIAAWPNWRSCWASRTCWTAGPPASAAAKSQRVALGRALACEPRVLLLDEPLSALDDVTRNEIYQLLRSVQHQTGVTALHVTHSQSEARALADVLLAPGAHAVSAKRIWSAETRLRLGLLEASTRNHA